MIVDCATAGQAEISVCCVKTGVGFTVMAKFTTALTQPFRVAVAVILPVTGIPVTFDAAVKLMSPVLGPTPNPIAELSLLQLITEPGVFVTQVIDTDCPAQTLCAPGLVSTGCAFKVILNTIGALVQLFFVAVTVATPIMSAPVRFDANVHPGILPVVPLPLARPSAAEFVTFQT